MWCYYQWIIYKVPAQYYLTEPALGGYMLLLKSTWSYLQSPCLLLHNDPALGGYKWYEYNGGTFSRLMLATTIARCYQYLQTGYFGNDKPASSTSSSWLKIRWVFHDQYFFCEKPMSAKWLWSWLIDPDFLEEGNTKELRMIRCRLTRVLNPKHNPSKLFLCLFYRISLTWMNPN